MNHPFPAPGRSGQSRRSLAISAALAFGAQVASAQTDGTWDEDANGIWSTTTNWVDDIIADGSGSTAYFTNDITADRTVSLDSDREISNLVFGDSDTTTAGSWILNNNGTSINNLILSGTTPTITVNALGASKTGTISAIIEGADGLVKAGAGRLDLTGANTFTGGVTIKEGRLSVSGSTSSTTTANPIGSSAGTILIGDTTGSASAAVFGASPATNNTYTIANALTVQTGSDGTKEFGAYSNTVTYSGAITLNDSASFRHLGGLGTLTSSGGISVATGKTLTINPNAGSTIAISGLAAISGQGAVSTTGSGGGQVNLTGNSTFSGGFTMGGSATLAIQGSGEGVANAPTKGVFGTGTATLAGGSIRSTNGSDTTINNTLNLSGTITGVTVATEKSLIFSGTGTLTGDTTFASAIGSTVSGKSMTFSGNIGDGGNGYGITKSAAGEVTLSGSNTFSGATKVTAGRLTLSNSLALQNSAFDTTSVAGSATAGLKTTVTTLTFGGLTGNNALAGRFLTGGGYSGVTSLTLNPQSGSVSYSGAIADGAAGMTLTKTGSGTQVLSGASTYTGGTIIEAGVLSVNDSSALGSGSGSITLNGGTLTVTNATTNFSARPSLTVGANGGTYNKSGNGQSQLPNIDGADNTLNIAGANSNSGLIVLKQTGTNTLGTLNLTASNTSVDFGTNTSIDTINLSSPTHIANLNTGGLSANVGDYNNVSFTLGNGGMIRNRFGQNTLSTAITLAGDGVIANRATTEAFTFSGNVSSSEASGTQILGILTDAANGHQGTVTQSAGSVISDGVSGGQVALAVGADGASGTVILNGVNTYSGPTTVNGGTLKLAAINPNNDGSTITVGNDAKIDIAFSGDDTVATLILGGTEVGPGSYNATHPLYGGFFIASDTGSIVVPAPAGGFAAWAAANAPGQSVDEDHDNDGVPNGIEYFMGESGSGFTASPGLDGTNTITWPMGATYAGTYGTDYRVQTSGNLVDWINVDIADVTITPGVSLAHTVTGPGPRFVRLVVLPD